MHSAAAADGNQKETDKLDTDHTALHSLEVIDFCNQLIGENIDEMNADEIYVFLMWAYLHDSGMGITMSDYEKF